MRVLLKQASDAFDSEKDVNIWHEIKNTDRSVGTVLSYEISKRFGGQGLMPGRIKLNFTGSAGQSFMAFGARGIRAVIEGDANDYCGKGLSGGEIILKPSPKASFKASENVICGNTALYGATSGYLFVNGIAGERFAVRNSGAIAVVEGTGDHGCEYMTGGCVVVIGKVGVNFAAGMSGGIIYVLDEDGSFSHSKVNHELVSLTSLALSDKEDELMVQDLLRKHLTYTNSEVACRVLADWDYYRTKFIRVLPNSYREILMQKRKLCRQKVNGDNNFDLAQMTTAAEGYHHG
jgi:glutamate synthase domain-containing protein 3